MAERKQQSRKQSVSKPAPRRLPVRQAGRQGGPGGEVVLYEAPDGRVTLDVRLKDETLWINLNQMSALFERDKSVISRHLRNIFREGELKRHSVVAIFATTAADGKTYQVEYYNLDAIISVGYRVNSKRGTQFRIWATQVLRDHILKGYTVNAKRLAELKQAIRLVTAVADRRTLTGDEASALLRVVSDYTFALDLLDAYDHDRLPQPAVIRRTIEAVDLDEARRLVTAMRKHFGGSRLFGQEKDAALESSLMASLQTAAGEDVYQSPEEKAAALLYYLVKNHPFVDGNKRIGAALFLRFLEKNGLHERPDGSRRLSNEALVALTLLIAESAPTDKDALMRLTAYLLQDRYETAVEGTTS